MPAIDSGKLAHEPIDERRMKLMPLMRGKL